MALRRTACSVNVKKIWLGDKGVYPIMGIVAAGCGWSTYAMYRHMSGSVDISVSKTTRATPVYMRDNFSQGAAWRKLVWSQIVEHSTTGHQA